ncbi:hypothetical protein BGW39_009685 [Mortierella sp. 14UC]|nr:hypothetical protein BGW39_009685 [Mortierella sp. 14UC]
MSSTQESPTPHPTSPTAPSSGHSESITDKGRPLPQLDQTGTIENIPSGADTTFPHHQVLESKQLGPVNLLNPLGHHVVGYSTSESDELSVSSGKSPRIGVRKRLRAFFKSDHKGRNTAEDVDSAEDIVAADGANPAQDVSPAQEAATIVLVRSGQSTYPSTAKAGGFNAEILEEEDVNVEILAVICCPDPPRQLDGVVATQLIDIFPKNVSPATLSTLLPEPRARIEQTPQLVYCCQLLSMAQPLSPTSDAGELQATTLDEFQNKWVQLIGPTEQDHLCWLVDKVVRAFVEEDFKGSTATAEVVLVGPILDRETYRYLLCCFIGQFEHAKLLNVVLLQGLVQLVECASVGYLVDDDLVRIATVLFKDLPTTHKGTSDHVLLLTLALGRVFDVMVAGKIKDLNRDRDHQPMLQMSNHLKDSENTCLKYQAAYAHQALQYVPDNETPLHILWRYSKLAAAGASTVSSVFKLDPAGLLQGLGSLQEIGASVAEVVKAGIEGYPTLASEKSLDFMKKRSWYLALQGTALLIRQGRLSDFKQVVSEAPCRHDANFQWGICRQLGEIAVGPLWDAEIRKQAVDFLGELYRSNTFWKQHVDIKRWILTLLVQVSALEVSLTKERALALLDELRVDSDIELPGAFFVKNRLPLPTTFPLLFQVQEISKVEYDLYRLKMQWIEEYNLQALDDSLFPLMDKVEEFLASDGQVMLILGDSGSGKSTFNRYLEYLLWQRYKPGGHIPLFINLPSLERPEKELVAEKLRSYDYSEEHIRELKQHRGFILICDGYDESQLTTNLHTTNDFNRAGHWNVKLLITCRTQYLGPDYRDRFVPKDDGQYHGTSNDLFLEVVISPFSSGQIELYVDKYIPLEPRTWVKQDYMDELTGIPNLMDLVKNPFLLILTLKALPDMVEGKNVLAKLSLTRVQLYDTFAKHWLGVNKRRLQDLKLKDDKQLALEDLLADGFEQDGIDFQKRLAAAIFREQEGRPVVEYSQRRDKATWKYEFFSTEADVALLRESSLLSRSGNQHRFIHRSILEYFFSCAVWDPSRSDDEISSKVYFESTGASLSSNRHPLSQRNIIQEPSIIQFLVERVKTQPYFKQHLLALVESSKSDAETSQVAANAITILIRAGVRFNGADLRGIRIPGANLTGGQFDSAQFQDSDLTNFNFTKAWIRKADFTRA